MISDATAMRLLSPGTRKWVSKQGWDGFRDIQRATIELMLSPDAERTNVIVSANVAGGKTESAFLPALSLVERDIAENKTDMRVRILYVAPLKALINDQYRRVSDIASYCGIDTYMWHSDAPQGQKDRLLRQHDGIMMTTPESLESFLMNRGAWCSRYLRPMVIIIDEFHSFLGQGRGKQLTSLLSRLSVMCQTPGYELPIRIALSATLSRLDIVADMLDPDNGATIISAPANDVSVISVRSYEPVTELTEEGFEIQKPDFSSMARTIIDGSGMDKTLTFCQSRGAVESMTTAINDELSTYRKGTFDRRIAMPHHGLLSKQTREELEQRLVSTDKPTMAVATVTLELGIDIGDIKRVYQVSAPSGVASMRQRMGRSGRRDGTHMLDVLIPLNDGGDQPELVRSIAEIELMKAGWFEPPNNRRRDISVLLSEILSVIKQYGSAYADEVWELLCEYGTFRNVTGELFGHVIEDMVENDLLQRMKNDTLLIGPAGEQEVSDWHFYATFQEQEAYTVKSGKKTIGEVTPQEPDLQRLAEGGVFKLGGKYWQTTNLDSSSKTIEAVRTSQRAEYMKVAGGSGPEIAGKVKQVGISLLNGKMREYVPSYLDELSMTALTKAREGAGMRRLNGLGLSLVTNGMRMSPIEMASILADGYTNEAIVSCSPPVDSATANAIRMMLAMSNDAIEGKTKALSIDNIPLWRLSDLVNTSIANASDAYGNEDRLIDRAVLGDIRGREKNNHYFSDETLRLAYGPELVDIDDAMRWMRAFQRFYESDIDVRNGERRS